MLLGKEQMERSKRLEMIMELVEPGSVPADIGTDHGFLPIELVRRGICPAALACDVRPGPLSRASEHIQKAGLSAQIPVRLSDGFAAVKPGEVDTAVIAGMGGGLMVRILSEGEQVLSTLKTLVLSPHSEWFKVRKYLRENGWQIEAERMTKEEGKYYPAMRAGKKTAGEKNSEDDAAEGALDSTGRTILEDCYGPLLLAEKNQVLKQYLLWQKEITENILEELEKREGEAAAGRRTELLEEWENNRLALQVFEQSGCICSRKEKNYDL